MTAGVVVPVADPDRAGAAPGTVGPPAGTDAPVTVGPPAGVRDPDDGAAETARRLRLAVARLSRRIAHGHPEVGVTPGRLVALSVLELTGPVRIGALADQLGTSPPTASRLVDCLHERGLVGRTPDPDDHRAIRVALTAAGLARLHDHHAATTDDLAGRIGELPADHLALLTAALPVLEEIARRTEPGP